MDITRKGKFTMSAGPIEGTDRTLRALSRPIYYHYDPEFFPLYLDTVDKLKKVFQTKQDVIIMQGEALLAIEAAAACCFRPGDKVLNLVSGIFGHEFKWYIDLYGAEAIEVRVPFNSAIDPDDVKKALDANPDVKFLSVVHSETPSGTLNPIKEICTIAKEHGVISIVDVVSSFAGIDIRPDEWGMDITIAGPQKCLGSPPGLGMVAVSEEAWNVMRNVDKPLRFTYMSMLDWKEQIEAGKFPFTPFVSEICALNEALTQVLEEGLESVFARHDQARRMCIAGVKGMGLELWAEREDICGVACTAIKNPEGLDNKAIRMHMYEKYGVLISAGLKELTHKVLRIGHMGKMAHPMYVVVGLAALERTLYDLGYPVKLGSGVGAALEAV